VKTDSNHVPTSVDAYTVGALKEWFNDRDLATDLQLSLNKNRLASMGSNFCDHTKLGFKDAAALEKAHKSVDLKYLRQTNKMRCGSFTTQLLSTRQRRRPCQKSGRTRRHWRMLTSTSPTSKHLCTRSCSNKHTHLKDSDTMLTLENTHDAIKRAQNYIDRQDTVGEKRVVF
jgi:hypothetical protein